MIDADGTIVAKYFENSLFLRASADQLLRAALGEHVELEPLETPATAEGQVDFDVRFDGEISYRGVLRDLIVRFAVPDGFHLYGEPVPDGMVATSVEIDDVLGLIVKEPILPATRPHTLEGTGETLQVFDGDVVVRVPITHIGRSTTTRDDGVEVQPITGTVRWQACDDHTCHLPRTETFSIEIPVGAAVSQADDMADPDGMNVATHFVAMTARKTDRPLGEIMSEMTSD